jgi:acylphosphatase
VPSPRSAARFFVTGKVQGVWFRASTRARALELGVAGHARNLPDGRVEVLAVGDPAAVDMLAQWLGRGPEHAVVTDVARFRATDGGEQGFTTA